MLFEIKGTYPRSLLSLAIHTQNFLLFKSYILISILHTNLYSKLLETIGDNSLNVKLKITIHQSQRNRNNSIKLYEVYQLQLTIQNLCKVYYYDYQVNVCQIQSL
jgi:hypothetical protein